MFTTQTMTEAEALCDRIAIMVNGGLCCITETEKLKELVGGYHLIINKKNFKKKKSQKKSISPDKQKSSSRNLNDKNSEDMRLMDDGIENTKKIKLPSISPKRVVNNNMIAFNFEKNDEKNLYGKKLLNLT